MILSKPNILSNSEILPADSQRNLSSKKLKTNLDFPKKVSQTYSLQDVQKQQHTNGPIAQGLTVTSLAPSQKQTVAAAAIPQGGNNSRSQ